MATLYATINAAGAITGSTKFGVAVRKMQQAALSAQARLTKLNTSMHSLGVGVNPATLGTAQFSASLNRMGVSATASAAQLKTLNASMASTATTSKAAGAGMKTMFFGFTAFATVAMATKAVKNFEESMATLKAVAVTSNVPLQHQAKVFEELRVKALQLGATTRYTATEAGEGLLYLARAGFTATEQLDAIDATLGLATTGLLDLGQAADFASNIVSQFGLAASETERVADALVNTSNRSNTNVTQMAEAMKYAGPVAGALGIKLETAAAAVGVLGDRGIQASMAGTNLRGAMLALAAPTTRAQKAFKELGVTVDDVNPAKRDWVDIWETFGNAFDNLEDKTRKAALANAIFMRRNTAGALIMADSTKKMRELIAAQEDNRGATLKQAAAMEDTLAGAFRRVRSAAESLAHATGDSGLAGGLRYLTDTLASTLRLLAGTADAEKDVTASSVLLANSIRAVTMGFIALKSVAVIAWLKRLYVSYIAMYTTFKVSSPLIGTITLKTNGLAVAWRNLTAAMAKNPLTVVAIGLTAIVTSLYLFRDATLESSAAVSELDANLIQLDSSIEAFLRYEGKLARALDVGDTALEMAALRGQMIALESISENLRNIEVGVVDGDIKEQIEKIIGKEFKIEARFGWESATVGEAFYTEDVIAQVEAAIKEIQSNLDAKQLSLNFDNKSTEIATSELAKYLNELEDNAVMAGKTASEQEVINSLRKVDNLLLKEGKFNLIEQTLAYSRLSVAMQKKAENAEKLANKGKVEISQYQKNRAAIESLLSSYAKENTLLGLSTEKREEEMAVHQLWRMARKDNKVLTEEEITQTRELEQQLRALVNIRQEGSRVAKIEKEVFGYDDAIAYLNNEVALRRLTNEERQVELTISRLVAAAAKDGEHFSRAELAILRQKAKLIAQDDSLTIDTTRLTMSKAMIEGLQREVSLSGLLNNEREKQRAVDAYRAALIRDEVEGVDALVEAYGKLFTKLQGVRDVQAASDDMARAVTGGIQAVVFQTESAGDALQNLLKNMTQAIFDFYVTKKLLNSLNLTQFFTPNNPPWVESAKGNVFMGGDVIPFAKGGYIDRTAIFPLKGNTIGVAGEAGREAALPITRLSNGDLGVKYDQSKNKEEVYNTTNVTMNVTTPNADSFRKSQRQIMEDLRR